MHVSFVLNLRAPTSDLRPAMNDIGVTKFNRVPAGYPENRITLQSFLEEAESALRNVFK